MITIVFEPHSTTFDNENNVASGWFDDRLSPAGAEQAKEMGRRYADNPFDAIFCSDLKRAYQTATIAFDFNPRLIFSDWRLRECDYGQYTQASKQEVNGLRSQHISEPFIDGESYNQVVDRVASFLADLKKRWDGKRVLIIGHRGTHYGLDFLINNKPLEQSLAETFTWQPGWQYTLQ
ncbi:MAG: histidine phosphatase family protein [Patescibacteria group bacterium]